MRKLLGMALVLASMTVGCESMKSKESADACGHCPGVQKMDANGACEMCHGKMVDGKCTVCNAAK